jgi:very-short-patch-repair endonuclease
VEQAVKQEAENLLAIHLTELGLTFVREYKFCKDRKWRADFAIEIPPWEHKATVLVEIEGGIWRQGRHTRGTGFIADLEKYNTAAMLGYRLLRFSTQHVLEGQAKAFLKEWLT